MVTCIHAAAAAEMAASELHSMGEIYPIWMGGSSLMMHLCHRKFQQSMIAQENAVWVGAAHLPLRSAGGAIG